MFFILMVLEIIVLISLTTLYTFPLYSNIDKVRDASQENTLQIVNSFNFLFVRKYYNLATDLLLIAKHNYPMYLTLTGNANPGQYPTYNKGSAFLNSYKASTCLIQSTTFNINSGVKNLNDQSQSYNLYQRILNDNRNFSIATENDIIDAVFGNNQSSQMTYYPDNSLNDIGLSYPEEPTTYFCYTVSMLKTIMTRNMIFEKNNGFVDRFLLFIRNKYIFQYPVEIMNDKRLSYYPYYNNPSGSCTGIDCFTTFTTFNAPNYNPKSDIFFDVPTFINGYGYGN
jgi:hypothetical protein